MPGHDQACPPSGPLVLDRGGGVAGRGPARRVGGGQAALAAILEETRADLNMPGVRAAVRFPDGRVVRAAAGLADPGSPTVGVRGSLESVSERRAQRGERAPDESIKSLLSMRYGTSVSEHHATPSRARSAPRLGSQAADSD